MAKHTSQSSAAVPPFMAPDLEKFSRINAEGMETLMHSGNALMKAVGELNTEILGFTKQRLDAGLAVSQSLAKCKTMQAAMEVQMDFARSETQVYLDEARKLMELTTQAAMNGLKPLQDMPNGRSNGRR
jgi:hypothetical protein